MEYSEDDSFALVNNKKKRKLSSAKGECRLVTQTDSSASDLVFRLAFLSGVEPRVRAIWMADVVNMHHIT